MEYLDAEIFSWLLSLWWENFFFIPHLHNTKYLQYLGYHLLVSILSFVQVSSTTEQDTTSPWCLVTIYYPTNLRLKLENSSWAMTSSTMCLTFFCWQWTISSRCLIRSLRLAATSSKCCDLSLSELFSDFAPDICISFSSSCFCSW